MIIPFKGIWPKVHETSFVAPSADIIGDVEIGSHSSVWFQVVIRGDVHWIRIGERTNVQDGSVLHVTRMKSPLTVGDDVTVGHSVTLHGCTIGNRVLIGMSATIMDDAEIPDDCIVGAGALVTKGFKCEPGSLIMSKSGGPAQAVRKLTEEERAFMPKSAANYVGDSAEYRATLRGPKRLDQSNEDLEAFYEDHS